MDNVAHIILCLTNEGKIYDDCVALAQDSNRYCEIASRVVTDIYGSEDSRPLAWVALVRKGLRMNHSYGPTDKGKPYTAQEILRAAAELADHFAEHVAQINAEAV